MWKYMSWSCILDFYGVFYHNGVPAIVTTWMPAGNITEYLEKHVDINRFRLASSSVLPASGINSLCALPPYSFPMWPKGSGTSITGPWPTGTSNQ